MSSLTTRLRAHLGGGMRQRITRGGWAFTAAMLVVGAAAFVSANNLLFLLLAAMLATMLVSGFVSRLSLAGLGLDFRLPEHVSARRTIAARVLVHNQKGWMSSFSLHVSGVPPSVFASALYFPVVPGGATLEETVDVSFARRGIHREHSFQVASAFPFGFTERRAQVALPREVLVYPCVDAQAGFEELYARLAGEMEAYARGRGHDFYRIRPYEPLESARHLDWKATAHTGALQVREFAREQDPLVEIWLDLDVPEPARAWFERAVEFAAFLIWRLGQRGARLRFQTQEFDRILPVESDVYGVLKYLGLVAPRPGSPPIAAGDEAAFRIVLGASARPPSRARSDESEPGEGTCLLGVDAFPAVRPAASTR